VPSESWLQFQSPIVERQKPVFIKCSHCGNLCTIGAGKEPDLKGVLNVRRHDFVSCLIDALGQGWLGRRCAEQFERKADVVPGRAPPQYGKDVRGQFDSSQTKCAQCVCAISGAPFQNAAAG